RMLYIFLIAACLCSNYMVASEKLDKLDTKQNKEYYDKIIAERIKDPVERAKYDEGYFVVEGVGIIPISEAPVMVPVGNGGFMTFPYHQAKPILEAMEKNKQEM